MVQRPSRPYQKLPSSSAGGGAWDGLLSVESNQAKLETPLLRTVPSGVKAREGGERGYVSLGLSAAEDQEIRGEVKRETTGYTGGLFRGSEQRRYGNQARDGTVET